MRIEKRPVPRNDDPPSPNRVKPPPHRIRYLCSIKLKPAEKMDKEEEILFHAEKLLYYNDLLIKQCNSWLPEEEGNRIMMQQFIEREKASRKKNGMKARITRFIKQLTNNKRNNLSKK